MPAMPSAPPPVGEVGCCPAEGWLALELGIDTPGVAFSVDAVTPLIEVCGSYLYPCMDGGEYDIDGMGAPETVPCIDAPTPLMDDIAPAETLPCTDGEAPVMDAIGPAEVEPCMAGAVPVMDVIGAVEVTPPCVGRPMPAIADVAAPVGPAAAGAAGVEVWVCAVRAAEVEAAFFGFALARLAAAARWVAAYFA